MADDVIWISPDSTRMRPSDARALTKATGHRLNQLIDMNDPNADFADMMQAFAFIELRRRDRIAGVPERDPAEVWEEAGEADCALGVTPEVRLPDPLSDPSS